MEESELLNEVKLLPSVPGCYLFLDEQKKVLYVGKAKNLRRRVLSYFKDKLSLKNSLLLQHVRSIDFVLTDNEHSAFVLENNLIKKHSPKYNIRLRDDKSYPYVEVDYDSPFPRLSCVRRHGGVGGSVGAAAAAGAGAVGHSLFGPFVTGSDIVRVVRIVNKSLKLRGCSSSEFRRRRRACVLSQIEQCSAPCDGRISTDAYQENLKLGIRFFSGEGRLLLKQLREQMFHLAEEEKFEKAAIIRDYLFVLERWQKEFGREKIQGEIEFLRSKFSAIIDKDIDVIAHYCSDKEVDIVIYMLRGGLWVGQKNFFFSSERGLNSKKEEIINHIWQYYQENIVSHEMIKGQEDEARRRGVHKRTSQAMSPKSDEPLNHFMEDYRSQQKSVRMIVTDLEDVESSEKLEERDYDSLQALRAALAVDLADTSITVVSIRDFWGKQFSVLFKLAQQQAIELHRIRLREDERGIIALKRLQELLKLPELPLRIECYDVAVWQGESPTAAQVVFYRGLPQNDLYRHYKLETRAEGNNDFRMLEEVISRRVENINDCGELPEVIVVDGGKGQRSSAERVLKEKNIHIPVIALAKDSGDNKFKKDQGEMLFLPKRKNPLLLAKERALWGLLSALRNESHRFCRRLHHHTEEKSLLNSWFDDIPGMGEKTKQKILSNLQVSVAQLAEEVLKLSPELRDQKLGEMLAVKLNKTLLREILKKLEQKIAQEVERKA
ncbi:MAG: excinuclease ABC subunit UvrC [Oligoflexia bacterium]|nr:excinuclease ABC subunit UvrC [Oligoflexia bacterium]